jgi:hypothetical protein
MAFRFGKDRWGRERDLNDNGMLGFQMTLVTDSV